MPTATIDYSKYTERKLHSLLTSTKATISKITTEKNRLDKKLESATKKEMDIKRALLDKLEIPSDKLLEAINSEVVEVLDENQSFSSYTERRKLSIKS